MFRPALIAAVLATIPCLAAPANAGTMQQDFDAAQALLTAGKWAEASAAFTALIARLPADKPSRTRALLQVRLGQALFQSNGPTDARPVLRAAIAGLAGTTPGDKQERALAGLDLGAAEEALGNIDSAAAAYRAAAAEDALDVNITLGLKLQVGLARTQIWSNPGASRSILDRLLALPEKLIPARGDLKALILALRGRVELNDGQPKAALEWIKQAVKAAGGTDTSSVNLTDIRVRGDLLIAYYLLRQPNDMQTYVAYSGAGGLVYQGLALPANAATVQCAPLTGVAADAVAVIEFEIGENGEVASAAPIFVNRGASVVTGHDDGPETLFTQAVRNWSFAATEVKKVKLFWRTAVRAEVRCFNSATSANPALASFQPLIRAWNRETGIIDSPPAPDNDAAALALQRTELARRAKQYGADSPQLLPLLNDIAVSEASTAMERADAAGMAAAILAKAPAPADIQVLNAIVHARNSLRYDKEAARAVRALVASPSITRQLSARVAALAQLRLLDGSGRADAGAILDSILAQPKSVIGDNDPLRIEALLRRADLATASKDIATAAALIAQTGLSAEQCALIDVRPDPINRSITSNDFPLEAERWQSSGLITIAFDITADGKTTNVRTVMAIPPFAFDETTERAVGRFRYQPVLRPGNTIGCTGGLQGVKFTVK